MEFLKDAEATWGLLSHLDAGKGLVSARALVKRFPSQAEAYDALSSAYSIARLYDDAATSARKGLDIDSASVSLWNSLGSALEGKEDYVEAAKAYRQSIKINPTNSPTWRALASALLGQGSELEAIMACNEAIKLDPQNSFAYGTLGHIHAKLGDMESAKAAYGKAAAIARARARDERKKN
jgi:tetratricopeptide (TPR) repeat protein